ncbi:Rieske (2Fe-2S) protein [Roseateles sp. LKC17W]|uniref:Rieske (2Fe-2S) protein n=1 Tax=Pelomonas margarita TaxID=3299031 RepID=A0ABW7FE98_9BURK
MTRLCHQQDLAEGQVRGFDPEGRGQDSLLLVRHQGRLHAWRNACPHVDGAPLAWRRDAYLSADGRHIVCYAHGARFDIATGRCISGAALGQALSPLRLRIQNNGEVHLAPPHPQETNP